jgi:hypothetical protein
MLRFALKAVVESFGAAYASALLAYLAAFGIILVIGDHRWIDEILISPTFLLPIAAGALFACVLRDYLSKGSYFAWVVPSAFLLGASREVSRHAASRDVWDALFGTNCRASECLYEAFFTLPFVCALSYSVAGACIRAGGVGTSSNSRPT